MAKAAAKAGKKKSFKKKEKRNVPTGLVHVQASFNNTIITITDPIGNVLSWSSSGSLGFRGSRKGTPYAAQQASLTAANKAKESGLRSVEVRVSGPGAGRESAVRCTGDGGSGSPFDSGSHADSAQRMRPPKKRRV
jgi:small subunit ribosomal protein S11